MLHLESVIFQWFKHQVLCVVHVSCQYKSAVRVVHTAAMLTRCITMLLQQVDNILEATYQGKNDTDFEAHTLNIEVLDVPGVLNQVREMVLKQGLLFNTVPSI
jgi:hypothetical protein